MRKSSILATSMTIGVSLCLAIVPTMAVAETASAILGISARVPTICRVSFNGAARYESSNLLDLGSMTEFCNDSSGYRLIMHHPSGLQGAQALVNGHAVALSNGTETILVDTTVPTWSQNDLKIDLGNSDAADISSLSFRTEPKGISY